ncbi:MAG: hypothetical protein KC503_07120 [Myxococcales bacterium]|nr:hypothetical protein [Myxococcales bacterium]
MRRFCALALLVGVVVLSACSSGTTTPSDARRDADGAAPPPTDAQADLAADQRVADMRPDLPLPDPKRANEIVSGAGRSTSASYELQSQVGMPLGPGLQSGATNALRWNAAVIPW